MKRFLSIFLLTALLFVLCVPFSANAEEEKIQGDYGVDLSVWNVGGSKVMDYSLIDFQKAKEDGCEYAILRIGFEGSSTRKDTLDLAFIEYYNMAREAGMKLGIYFYALGTTYDEAVDDAQWVINVIEENDMYFEYPLYYDVETGPHYALNKNQMSNLCRGWCETLEKAGYYGGIYGRSDILAKLDDEFKSKYSLWLRYIKSDSPTAQQYDPDTLDISDQCDLWQYTMFQRFSGIQNDDLDGNFCYIDYPKFMAEKGYNNYTAELYEEMLENETSANESSADEEVSEEVTDEPDSSEPAVDSEGEGVTISIILVILIAIPIVIIIAIVVIVIVIVVVKKRK